MDNLGKMDTFLETCNLSKLNQEEAESLSRPITTSEIEAIIEKLQAHKNPRPDVFTGKFYQIFKRRTNSYPSQTIPKNSRRGRRLPNSFLQGQYNPNSKTEKENYRPISLMSTDAKNLNKILAIQIQHYIKKIIHYDQVGFIPGMQGWYNIANQ